MRIVRDIKAIILNLVLFLEDSAFIIFNSIYFKRTSDSGKKNILVIRLDAIGDAMLWLNAAQHLRSLYSEKTYNIVLVCNRTCYDIYHATGYFDHIINLDRQLFHRDFIYRYKKLKSIGSYSYETVLNPTFSRDYLHDSSIVRACSARNKIGVAGDNCNIKPYERIVSDQWYTKLVPIDERKSMEFERNMAFIEYLGADKNSLPLFEWKWSLGERELLAFGDKYVVIFPGASNPARMWASERFVTIAVQLYQATGWTIVIAGGKGEAVICTNIQQALISQGVETVNLAGQTTLLELINILKQASMLISNETSAIHIAVATRTPSVCILGGGHYGRFTPYSLPQWDEYQAILPKIAVRPMECFQCNWQCRYELINGVWPCIDAISIDDVWVEVELILNEISDRG